MCQENTETGLGKLVTHVLTAEEEAEWDKHLDQLAKAEFAGLDRENERQMERDFKAMIASRAWWL